MARINVLTRLWKRVLGKNSFQICTICDRKTEVSQMFGCLHRYCSSCTIMHIEVKLLSGMLPECPHPGCKSKITINRCRKFLSPKLVERMDDLIEESSIPVTDRIYCPFARCSALMSKTKVREDSSNLSTSHDSGVRKCMRCQCLFCINCKCPWHSDMTCSDYGRLNPHSEDAKLKSLAMQSQWRQCKKCNHMIELHSGCHRVTCRCGFKFCYICGAEWNYSNNACSCRI